MNINSRIAVLQQRHISLDKAVEITNKRVKLISENLKEPHILYLKARMSLTNYMWCLHGNTSKWFKKPQLPLYF